MATYGLKPSQVELTRGWLMVQMKIAARELMGESLTDEERDLIKKNPGYTHLKEVVDKEIVQPATTKKQEGSTPAEYDLNKVAEGIAGHAEKYTGLMIKGEAPKGFMDVMSDSVSRKFSEAKWDDNDISGSIQSYLGLVSPGGLIDSLKEGFKQWLLSMGMDHFAAELKSMKSVVVSKFKGGEALTVAQADDELHYQKAFAALAKELEIDSKDTDRFGNVMAQVVKRHNRSHDYKQMLEGTPEKPQGQPLTQNLDSVLDAIKDLTPEQRTAIRNLSSEQLQQIAGLDGSNGVSDKDIMEAFKKHIIPEANGKLVELKPEDLSKLASALSAKQAGSASPSLG